MSIIEKAFSNYCAYYNTLATASYNEFFEFIGVENEKGWKLCMESPYGGPEYVIGLTELMVKRINMLASPHYHALMKALEYQNAQGKDLHNT